MIAPVTPSPGAPLKVVISYAHRDKHASDKLLACLKPLTPPEGRRQGTGVGRAGLLEVWHDRSQAGGDAWREVIGARLAEADVVLLLVSQAFLASFDCMGEVRQALARHEHGQARVVPVIFGPCEWSQSALQELHALPAFGRPIQQYRPQSLGWHEVTEGLRKIAKEWPATAPAPDDDHAAGDRPQPGPMTAGNGLPGCPPPLRAALEAAAVPHAFDVGALASLIDAPAAVAAAHVSALAALPCVERAPYLHGWRVRPDAREALRARLAREDDARFRLLSRRAASHFEGRDTERRTLWLYHRLAAEPETGARELRCTWDEWDDRGLVQPLKQLGDSLGELLHEGLLSKAQRARAMVCHGHILQDRAPLHAQVAAAQEALRLFVDAGDGFGQADARLWLGTALYKSHRSREALAEFEAAADLLREVAREHPGDADARRQSAVAQHHIGNVLRLHGRAREALRAYRACRDILESLLRRDPERNAWRRDWGVAHNQIGRAHEALGRLPQAESEYRTYRDAMADLLAREPDNPNVQRELSTAHDNLGCLLRARGRAAEALPEHTRALALIEALARADPDNTDWQRDLEYAHHNLGRALEALDRRAEARSSFEQALRVAERLARADPENRVWQDDWTAARKALDDLAAAA